MSIYESYSKTSAHYDQTRAAQGSELWIGAIARSDKSASGVHLLDAGCGTGNYAHALAPHVAKLTAIDLNPDMLAQAANKLDTFITAGVVELTNCSLSSLPFADTHFDAVMINQVLHHLDDGTDRSFPALRQVITEFARVLKPGGLLLLNACSRRQIAKGFWYYTLIPAARDAYLPRVISTPILQNSLTETGFATRLRTAVLDPMMTVEAYFNPRGPLDPSWRSGDSIWATVSDKELSAAIDMVQERDNKGELELFMMNADRERNHIGQMTFWICEKTGEPLPR